MIALARYVMAGPMQAALVAVVAALLALIIPPAAWISAAVVALVVLHLGPNRGLQLIGLCSVAGVLLSWLVLGTPIPVFGVIMLIWLPVWLAAIVLRQTVSLPLTLQLVTGLGVILMLLVLMMFPQMETQLNTELQRMVQPMLEQQTDEQVKQELQDAVDMAGRLMPALIAAGMILSTTIGLLLGRNWQATLYNPGGFAREFNQLRLGRVMAGLGTLLLLGSVLLQSQLLNLLLVVLLSVYLVQGVAVIHGIVDLRQANRGWLFGVYIALILLPQISVAPIALFGLSDAWVDFRRRLSRN